jgi:hypothetical protein
LKSLDKELIATMDNETSSNINSADRRPVKFLITIGNLTVIPLDKSLKNQLKITEWTSFTQEITEDGILLRPVRDNSKFRELNENG